MVITLAVHCTVYSVWVCKLCVQMCHIEAKTSRYHARLLTALTDINSLAHCTFKRACDCKTHIPSYRTSTVQRSCLKRLRLEIYFALQQSSRYGDVLLYLFIHLCSYCFSCTTCSLIAPCLICFVPSPLGQMCLLPMIVHVRIRFEGSITIPTIVQIDTSMKSSYMFLLAN